DAIDNANTLLADSVDATIKKGLLPIVLGGDHSLAMGSLAGAVRNAEKVGVLWIDTHPDINTPQGSLSGHIHGMPLAVALGATEDDLPRSKELAGFSPMIQAEQIAYLGIRDIDLFEENLIVERNIFARTMDEWSDDGIIAGLEA